LILQQVSKKSAGSNHNLGKVVCLFKKSLQKFQAKKHGITSKFKPKTKCNKRGE